MLGLPPWSSSAMTLSTCRSHVSIAESNDAVRCRAAEPVESRTLPSASRSGSSASAAAASLDPWLDP
eukprot:3024861-Prymnesium_polylepis.1